MKLKLKADPTFQATVNIPIAGGKPAPVVFTFKHRTRDEHDAFAKDWASEEGVKRPYVDYVLAVAEGWDLDDPFTRENVDLLLQNYHRAGAAIVGAYTTELLLATSGN